MKSNTSIFKTNDQSNYVSMVDDYRRTKHFYYKKTINEVSEIVFLKLCESIKKSFKFSRDIEEGATFNLRIDGLSTKHRFSEFSMDDKSIQIEWVVGLDCYWMDFMVRKKFLSNKKTILKVKQTITRDKTFFGIQDFIGVYIYYSGFKKNCRSISKAIKELIQSENKFETE